MKRILSQSLVLGALALGLVAAAQAATPAKAKSCRLGAACPSCSGVHHTGAAKAAAAHGGIQVASMKGAKATGAKACPVSDPSTCPSSCPRDHAAKTTATAAAVASR